MNPILLRRESAGDQTSAANVAAEADVVTTEASDSAPPSCKARAQKLVQKYAVAGTVWALLPVPMATSVGLAMMETHLIYWVARIYGEHPTKSDIVMTGAGLKLASVGLRTVAVEGAMLAPGVGIGIKAGLAGSVVLALGHAVVQHYESKYPGRVASGS